MNYTNKICSVCGEAFKENDDIVVCPECATPHHRECWFKNGCCINKDKHAEGFVWESPETKTTPLKEEAARIVAEENNEDVKICHICGSENPSDTFHCGNCGAFFGADEEKTEVVNCAYCGEENDANAQRCKRCGAPVFRIFRPDNPYLINTGFMPDDPIGEFTAEEASYYTQTASKNYLKKFRKIDNGKITFNWAAFFFAPFWFFYRKLYKAGIAILLVFVSISLLTYGLSDRIYNSMVEFETASAPIMQKITETPEEITAEDEEAYMKAYETFVSATALPTALLFFIMICEKVISALIADRLYYKKLREDIKIINEAVPEKELRKIMILKRGRPSAMAFAASVLGESFAISALTAIAELFAR